MDGVLPDNLMDVDYHHPQGVPDDFDDFRLIPDAELTESLPVENLSLASRLQSKRSRTASLNHLLEVTANYELSYTIENEAALQALADIFFESVGSKRPPRKEVAVKPEFRANKAWTAHLTPDSLEWASYCKNQLMKGRLGAEALRVVEAILPILRNLSFVASNQRLLAFSHDVIDILTGSLYEQTSIGVGISEDTSTNMNTSAIAVHALQALVNLAPYIDITGQKVLCDKLFLVINSDDLPTFPKPDSYGLVADGKFGFGSIWLAKKLDAKEDQIADVPDELAVGLTNQYLLGVWAIFPAILKVFEDPTSPRLLLMMAVDFLQELLTNARGGAMGQMDIGEYPTARSVLVNIPDVILRRLVDLLYTPRLGSDSLEYIDPTNCIVTRVNTLRMLLGYDATVDTDLRDRSLDVLVLLLELDSPNMASRLANLIPRRVHTQLFDSLMPILTSQAGRTEAPSLAQQLLKELSKANFSTAASRVYIHGRLVMLGSQDAKIAHLALNFIE